MPAANSVGWTTATTVDGGTEGGRLAAGPERTQTEPVHWPICAVVVVGRPTEAWRPPAGPRPTPAGPWLAAEYRTLTDVAVGYPSLQSPWPPSAAVRSSSSVVSTCCEIYRTDNVLLSNNVAVEQHPVES